MARTRKVKHVGFESAAKTAASKAGVSLERGRAMIAAGARKASAKAKKRNPRLTKVAGVGKKGRRGAGQMG
jgi:hypothetical protein